MKSWTCCHILMTDKKIGEGGEVTFFLLKKIHKLNYVINCYQCRHQILFARPKAWEIYPVHNTEIYPIHNILIYPIHNIEIYPIHNIEIYPIHNIKIYPIHNIVPVTCLLTLCLTTYFKNQNWSQIFAFTGSLILLNAKS